MSDDKNTDETYYQQRVPLLDGDIILYIRKGSKKGVWNCTIKLPKRARERFSTGARELEIAKQIAMNKYQALRTRLDDNLPVRRIKWDDLADHYLTLRKRVNAERFNKAYFREFFSTFRDVRLVTSKDIVDYWEFRIYYWEDESRIKKKFSHTPGGMYNISKKPNIRTLRHECNALKNIFMFGRNEGLLNKLPQIEVPKNHPNVETENQRGWFSEKEYQRVIHELMIRADPAGMFGINRLKRNHRHPHQTPQDHMCWLRLRFAVLVMANCGIRPQELKRLRWCDFHREFMPYSNENPVQIPFVYIRLSSTQSKVNKPREIFFRNPDKAWRWVTQFRELKAKLEPYPIKETDLVFRAYRRHDKPAVMSNMFKRLLIDLDLRYDKNDPQARLRTMYSLRSFYITYQLTHNTGLPIHLLALQCGTSTKMIETTYAKIITRSFRDHLIATMRDDEKRRYGILVGE